MYRRVIATIATLALISIYGFILSGSRVDAQTLSGLVSERLRQRLEGAETPMGLTVVGESLYASALLPRFYAQRLYQSAWSDDDGLLPQVETFMQAIREAYDAGLDPHHYHLRASEVVFAHLRQPQEPHTGPDPDRLADLDLLLSDAFLTYGTHLLAGRMPPRIQDTTSAAKHAAVDLVGVLQEALSTGRILDALHRLSPPHTGYTRLLRALARYRQIAAEGGWPMIAAGASLHQGDRDERVVALRIRLRITGDLEAPLPAISQEDLFDPALEQAVRAFQQRHGLDVDGVVGPATRAALDVPVQVRLHQIARNLERWRRFPRQPGPRYIQVNIPNFMLDVMEYGQAVMTMRVVVGKPSQRTPVFSDTMTYVVLSPYWQVPRSIARREILPRLRQEPEYLASHNMTVLQGWGPEAQEIDPQAIDWATVTAKNFPYRLRQEAGPENALGRVKFIFPNRHQVYMHDTPSRALFAKSMRAFSHGCVRLEDPIALAEYVLRGNPRWTRAAIVAASTRGVERYVRLPEPIPVYLVYRTAWVNPEGTVHFRHDIYGHDKPPDGSFCTTISCG